LSSIHFFRIAALAAALAIPAAALAQQAPPAPAPGAPAGMPGQPGMHRHGGHGGGFRHALQSLNLSAAQKTQVQQVLAQSRGANRNADPATRKANREKVRSQIEAILTPAQRAQFQTALQQARQRHQRQGGAWASPAPNATPYH
jgi:Spy/CpxP family protein refolding chaperone